MPILGDGILPENFDFRGISGAPMITVAQHRGLRSWMSGGVFFPGPSTSDDPNEAIAGLEIIRARPAHFILPDGTLDKTRWERLEWQLLGLEKRPLYPQRLLGEKPPDSESRNLRK